MGEVLENFIQECRADNRTRHERGNIWHNDTMHFIEYRKKKNGEKKYSAWRKKKFIGLQCLNPWTCNFVKGSSLLLGWSRSLISEQLLQARENPIRSCKECNTIEEVKIERKKATFNRIIDRTFYHFSWDKE